MLTGNDAHGAQGRRGGVRGKDDPAGWPVRSMARAPAGARAGVRLQARVAIDSTSFHVGKRPVAFFE